MPNKKIKTKILFLSLGVSIISLLIFLIVTYQGIKKQGEYTVTRSTELGTKAANQSKKALEGQVKDYLTRLVYIQAKTSNEFFVSIESQINIMTHFLSVLWDNKNNFGYDKNDNVKKEKKYLLRMAPGLNLKDVSNTANVLKYLGVVFDPLLESNKDIEQIFLGTEKGLNMLWPLGSANAVKNYDPRTREWYIGAVKRKTVGWSDLFKAASTQKQLIACSKPIYDKGNLIGVVGMTATIEGLLNVITSQVKDLGYAFLIDKNGVVIASPGTNNNNWENDYGTQNLMKIKNQSVKSIIIKMINGDSGFSKIKLNSGKKFIGYAPIKETGWSLAIVISSKEALKKAIETEKSIINSTSKTKEDLDGLLNSIKFQTIILFIIIILTVLLLSNKMAENLSRPIKKLTEGINSVGSGNLDYKLDIQTGDEIELLANGFNKMTDDLKLHIEEIKTVTAAKEKIEGELKVATAIQASMLPRIFPAFPKRKEFEVYASMQPAKEVGGDLYDFFFVDENKFCFLIGDVSGKGVPASLFMALSKTLIKTESLRQKSDISPEIVFNNVNNALADENDECLFVTTFIVVIDLLTGEIEYSNAGHNPPMIKRKDNNKFDYIDIRKSFVLGGMAGYEFKKENFKMNPGDYFLLYTDGVTEAMNAESKQYSEARLEKVLTDIKDLNVEKVLKTVKMDIHDFVKETPASDDITMLVFKYNGPTN